jgi:hypothetical protein
MRPASTITVLLSVGLLLATGSQAAEQARAGTSGAPATATASKPAHLGTASGNGRAQATASQIDAYVGQKMRMRREAPK